MQQENINIHTLWIGDKLSLLECLTIKLLQKHNHTVNLWCYGNIENVPIGTILRDAREILPQDSIFRFIGKPPLKGIPNNGIGSLSHWSDQFQLKLLYKYGGIYLQLDVACLRPLDFKQEYTFASNGGTDSLAAFLMKCPVNSHFTDLAYQKLVKSVNPSTMHRLPWGASMNIMGNVLKRSMQNPQDYFLSQKYFLDLGMRSNGPFFESTPLPEDVYIIHWSNATIHKHKNTPIHGSIYHQLLLSVGLL